MQQSAPCKADNQTGSGCHWVYAAECSLQGWQLNRFRVLLSLCSRVLLARLINRFSESLSLCSRVLLARLIIKPIQWVTKSMQQRAPCKADITYLETSRLLSKFQILPRFQVPGTLTYPNPTIPVQFSHRTCLWCMLHIINPLKSGSPTPIPSCFPIACISHVFHACYTLR